MLSYRKLIWGHNVQVVPSRADGDQDKFKCLYLLVETAVAVRQREKEQEEAMLPV